MKTDRYHLRVSPRLRLGILATLILAVGVLAGWTASGSAVDAASARAVATVATDTQAPNPAIGPRAAITGPQASYADLVSQVGPAVVTIRSERLVRATSSPFGGDESLLEQLLGRQGRRTPRQRPHEEGALGSGVIVAPDGYILTNHHVVDGASQIRVELTDRRSFSAKVVGSDPPSDLALLKIDAAGLRTLPLGDSDRVRVGDVVLAIGNPLGLGQTVTMGIISAKGRATGLSDGSFEDFLQTDAPINQGNSGGALVDTRGELVGINSQILSPSGGSIGIGFAIPARMAQNVMQQLIKNGTVHRAKLGVTVQAVNSELAKSLGLQDVQGALVSTVEPGSPAQKAGIARGDVILTFNGETVSDSNALRNRVAGSQPGTDATLQVVRNGRQETIHARLAELERERARSNDDRDDGPNRGRYGLSVAPLTPDIADELGVKAKQGLVVQDVAPASPGSNAGIRSGDVIVEVNHKPVGNVSQFQEAMSTSSNRPALVLVNRQGSEVFLALSAKSSSS
ncbi:MAG TPA: DegQ family serine endoprotease [Vicinamibacterales bacterium]|jgi:Do/DeqQ family serine protease